MLKAHQASIDLKKNVLRIQDREVHFLSEHELPDKARFEAEIFPPPPPSAAETSSTSRTSTSFPGGGNTLGAPPANTPGGRVPARYPPTSPYPEEVIATLIGLGVTREVAISTLDAAEGNLDAAVSLLF